jgi:DNA-binding response OmpR family regulator
VGDPSLFERTILLVDTDRDFRRDAERALYRAGWDVREAASGEEALAIAAKEDVALAIVELRLIDMTGHELRRRLRERRGDGLPVLFVSDSREAALGPLAAADDHLVKPVELDELVSRVRRRLERAALPAGVAATA